MSRFIKIIINSICLIMVIVSCPNVEIASTYNLPSVPSGLNVENSTSSSLYISWNESDRAETYQLYRDISSNGSFSLLVYEGYATSYTDSNLDSYTTYYYKIKAINSFGSSDLSPYRYGTTEQLVSAPLTPTGLTVSNPTVSSLAISWNNSQDATSYQVYRDTNSQGDFAYLANNDNSTQFTDINLSSNTTYYYKVRATNFCGYSDLSDYQYGTTNPDLLPPPIPEGLTVENPTLSSLDILWNSSDGANNYRLYRYFSLIDSYLQIYSGPDTFYTDTNLSSGVTYIYKVRAENISASSDYSDTVSGKTLGPPSAPTGLTVGNTTFDSLSIIWNSSPYADGYKLYESIDDYFYFEIYDGTDCNFIDTNLHGGWIYYYKVAAYNTYGTGIKSTVVSGRTTEGELALSFFYDDTIYKQYMDADCKGFRPVSSNATVIFTEIYDDLNSYIGSDFQLIWIGSGTGTFSSPATGLKYGFNNEYESIYCSVHVTEYGQVGERIIGTFSAILDNEAPIVGSFGVLRGPDN